MFGLWRLVIFVGVSLNNSFSGVTKHILKYNTGMPIFITK